MLTSLLRQSIVNRTRAIALMVISVAMGTAVAASLITISLDISGKVSHELRSFGANIIVEPRVEGLADLIKQERFLLEKDLIKSKTIFWRHNILGITPFLELEVNYSDNSSSAGRKLNAVGTWFEHALPLPGEDGTFTAGVSTTSPWWDVKGNFPANDTVLLGITLAQSLGISVGDTLNLEGKSFNVSGTLSTGGNEDNSVFFDLHVLQNLMGHESKISRVTVSALTTPMDEFAYKNPDKMSSLEYEKWYCTGYVTSIAKQLEEVFTGSTAKPIWQVAQTEGKVLGRMSALMYLLTVAALLASALGMSTTMAASVLRRLQEVALMKAIGADSKSVAYIFLAEAVMVAIVGGLIGYGLSYITSYYVGLKVFGVAIEQRSMLFPVALLSAFAIASLGSLLPIRRAMKVKPAVVLKEVH